jgi:hypothetical protein
MKEIKYSCDVCGRRVSRERDLNIIMFDIPELDKVGKNGMILRKFEACDMCFKETQKHLQDSPKIWEEDK